MKVYELRLKIFLLKSIDKKEALERIGEMIDKCLTATDEFRNFHNSNTFKNYTFNSLYKLERDGIYKVGNIYSIKIRTVDEMLAKYFKKNLANEYTEHMKGLTLECNILRKKPIEKIYSITPVIIKTDEGYWKGRLSLESFEKRLRENIIKKYNDYFDTEISEDFELFSRIEFNNQKPIASSYKNVNFLGDKLTLYIAENEIAQNLAYLALGTGVGEINGRGYGFMNYQSFK
ncbi:CRISPR-associated endoribonuclease Cas6 [Clostridium formicaceticum]|uniref:CRISPR associated protein Cas6 n=1 Tax=Clostridium formicaceticum TaxID=1497 RepID=A0AAC9WFJ8_9CLOT|nr:CRISPR-associated endoribonuclease Cas6 [Clostridium formicaceticum]AOY76426.1 CRISPR-associated endoribonuclease Cas6 [Clostridium formicaceticum]ARE86821.1 CRISPR associated protein Cas6 [Clostridium formicaceticum]